MKKCLVCGRKIKEREICNSCEEFLKWKYGKNYKIHIENIKNYFSKSIKFRRAR